MWLRPSTLRCRHSTGRPICKRRQRELPPFFTSSRPGSVPAFSYLTTVTTPFCPGTRLPSNRSSHM